MLGDDTVWDDVAAELSDVARASFPRIDQHDTIASMAAAVLAEAPERFALAGHSLGGIVALEIVRQSPERVTRLALVNTSGRDASATQLESWATMVTRTKAGEFGEVAAELGHAHPARGASRRRASRTETAMAETVGADGFLRQLAAQATRPDSRPTLPGVGSRPWWSTGALDHVCPPALQRGAGRRPYPARGTS